MDQVKAAFTDLMARLRTDYIDVGMVHYVDEQKDFDQVFGGPVIEFAKEQKAAGHIREAFKPAAGFILAAALREWRLAALLEHAPHALLNVLTIGESDEILPGGPGFYLQGIAAEALAHGDIGFHEPVVLTGLHHIVAGVVLAYIHSLKIQCVHAAGIVYTKGYLHPAAALYGVVGVHEHRSKLVEGVIWVGVRGPGIALGGVV